MLKRSLCILILVAMTVSLLAGCSLFGQNLVKISEHEIRIGVGEYERLEANVVGVPNAKIVWKTTNPYVAMVTDGVVMGINDGIAAIIAEYNGMYAVCVVGVGNANVETEYIPEENPEENPEVNIGEGCTLGMGVIVSLDETRDGAAQIDATVATVVLDKDERIVACRLDAAQNKITLYDDGSYTVKNLKTKMELGNNYGMAAALNYGMDWNGDGVVKEWYEQAKAFEAFVVGKTAAEVEAMATQTMSNGYVISADDALLNAGCTIQITDFKAAVVKACKDDQAVSFKLASDKSFTLGVAVESYDNVSRAADEYGDGEIRIYSDFAASVVVDGKIVASLNDGIQPKIIFNTCGEIISKSFNATKRELKEDYRMSVYGTSLVGNDKVVEWYLQSAAFSAHVVGMTKSDVEAMGTQTHEYGYVISNDDALLSAGCTIQITELKAVVAESIENAR